MRLAFFANHNKTYFFRALQDELEKLGHQIFWIVPGNRLSRMLVRSGVSQARVLDLTTYSSGWTNGASAAGPWTPGELLPGKMQIYEMIGADRFLRERPTSLALAYLSTCAIAIQDFVVKGGIEAVLGEQTYAVELIAGAMLSQIAVPYLVPATVRIPSTRFTLFAGSHQAGFATDLRPDPADVRGASEFIANFAQKPERPYYFQRHQGPIRASPDWLLSPGKQIALQMRDPHEMNRPSLGWLLRGRSRQWINGKLNRIYPFENPEALRGLPYVLLTLHRQPEASLDVLGSKYSDQAGLARAAASDLPPGWRLVVKEHSNGLGDRGPLFFRRMKRIPGVVLVDPWSNSLRLASEAQLTLTVAGTLAFEAGLLGYPATTTSEMYFSPLLARSHVNPYDESLRTLLRDLRSGAAGPPANEARKAYMAYLFANSRDGLIGAPTILPSA